MKKPIMYICPAAATCKDPCDHGKPHPHHIICDYAGCGFWLEAAIGCCKPVTKLRRRKPKLDVHAQIEAAVEQLDDVSRKVIVTRLIELMFLEPGNPSKLNAEKELCGSDLIMDIEALLEDFDLVPVSSTHLKGS